MATVHYDAEVKSELLLALPIEAEELHLVPGDRISIQIDIGGESATGIRPNEGMLESLREIAERQMGLRYTDASQTDLMLMEARSGAMWESSSLE